MAREIIVTVSDKREITIVSKVFKAAAENMARAFFLDLTESYIPNAVRASIKVVEGPKIVSREDFTFHAKPSYFVKPQKAKEEMFI